MQPGVSMAAIAMSRGINANLLRRWGREAEMNSAPVAPSKPALAPYKASTPATFVPLPLPAPNACSDVRIELLR